ncbi:MAG: diguanylate cyclase [Deltaproteobacteria bacterium]|nr:diguanylate cyclase [Deltaproteobacteria bacterium]
MTEPKKKATILIVDDSEMIRNRIRKVLQQEKDPAVDCIEAEDGIKGYKELLKGTIDLVICDLIMPQIDGFKLMELVKNHPELKNIPMIMLTAEGEQKKKNRALEKGASDYLTKPFDDAELSARVRLHLELKLLHDQLKKANQQLTNLSNTDALTEIYNRRYLMTSMVQEIRRVKRYQTPLSFLIMDLDDFKNLNDTYGHQAGDQVLRDVCERLQGVLRQTDIFARYGGEEFALLMTQTPIANAERAAEKLRKVIAKTPFTIQGETIPVSLSGGLSCFIEGKIDTIDAMIMAADQALYQAKGTGKNRILVSEECLEQISVEE